MSLFSRSKNPIFRKLRYRAAGTTAAITLLSAVPSMAIARGTLVVGFAALGLQLALLLLLMRFLYQALRLARGHQL